ncbi:MAG: hypothetical protein K6U75_08230 [Firmicutes bacterium]|nr:hypothetical protein [Bacillota bacterium]
MRLSVRYILLAAAAFAVMATAWGQDNTPPTIPLAEGRITASKSPSAGSQVGQANADLLRGNGTRAGYLLRYGNIVPESERVMVDARTLQRNQDYTIDYTTGTIFFTEPVRTSQTIRVYYRYVPGSSEQRGLLQAPSMRLQFGQSQLNMMYSSSAFLRREDGTTLQTDTYGMQTRLNLNSNSAVEGLLFFSSQRAIQAVADPTLQPGAPSRPNTQAAAGSDRLILQNLNWSVGGLQLRGMYQDVGQRFAGFAALREQKAAPDQLLGWLEKERGMRRMSYGLGYVAGGMNLQTDVSRITDGKGDIRQTHYSVQTKQMELRFSETKIDPQFQRFNDLREDQRAQWAKERGLTRDTLSALFRLSGNSQLGFERQRILDSGSSIELTNYALQTAGLKLTYSTQDIDKEFTRFNDLAEGQRAQWAKERGWVRSFLRAELPPFKGTNLPNLFMQQTIRTETGNLNLRQISLNTQTVQVDYTRLGTDPSFAVANLTPEEINQMALLARQQVEPGANAVTDKDRQQVLREAGLQRETLRMNMTAAANTQVSVMKTTVEDASGDVKRMQVAYTSPKFEVAYQQQSISEGFNRLGDLTDPERKLYAAETGIARRLISTRLALDKNTAISALFGNIRDSQGSIIKQSYALRTPRLSLFANIKQVDPTFSRIGDLTETDRNDLSGLLGFKYFDMAAQWQVSKTLWFEGFWIDSHNAQVQQMHRRQRLYFQYQPAATTRITHLNDRTNRDGATEVLHRQWRETTAIDHALGKGLKFSAYRDRVEEEGVLLEPTTSLTNFWRVESDKSRPVWFVVEQKHLRRTDGYYDTADTVQVQTPVSRSAVMQFTEQRFGRSDRPSELIRTVSSQWLLRKDLTFAMSLSRRTTSADTGSLLKSFALSGPVLNFANVTGKYDELRVDRVNTKAQSEISVSSLKPFNALGLTNIQFTGAYAALADRATWQKETRSGRITANLGKHSLLAEYTSAFIPQAADRLVMRTYQFTVAPMSNFKGEIYYRMIEQPNMGTWHVRRYALDWQLNPNTSISHQFLTLPEQGNNRVQPIGLDVWKMSTRLNSRQVLNGEYRIETDYAKRQIIRRALLSVAGRLSALSSGEVGYSLDSVNYQGNKGTAHSFHLRYGWQLDDDHFLNLSLRLTNYQHRVPHGLSRNELAGALEYKTPF